MGIRDFFFKKNLLHQVKSGKISLMNLTSLSSAYDGSKTNFLNGFGLTSDLRIVDLRTLQFRSLQLMRENSFAASIFGRLETKVINTGLRLRCTPPSEILDQFMSDEDLQEWSGNTERLFEVWSKDKRLVSLSGKYTLGQLQRLAYKAALLSGDCLVILSVNRLGLPQIELVDGINIVGPPLKSLNSNVHHGVELGKNKQETAYYVYDGVEYKRVPAFTTRGRRRAWLVRATETRIDDVRGLPLLSVVLQNINEIGKYMDSEQRAALVNSYIAIYHTQSEKAAPGSASPFAKGIKKTTEVENCDGGTNEYKQMQPGYLMTNLLPGETVGSFDTKRPNVNFGPFVEFCMKTMAQALEIPPEIMFLEFKSNFSASRQAKLDFNDYVQKAQAIFSESFTQPIYNEWLTGMVLTRKINASGYVNALVDLNEWAVLGAWRSAKWRGLPNKSVDELKQVKALEIIEAKGWMTSEDIADEYFSTDYYANTRRIKKEREALGVVVEEPTESVNILREIQDFINSFEAENG